VTGCEGRGALEMLGPWLPGWRRPVGCSGRMVLRLVDLAVVCCPALPGQKDGRSRIEQSDVAVHSLARGGRDVAGNQTGRQ
jgi:hypothetical protein